MDKQIIIDAEGHINIVGKWKIGELFNVAQSLMNSVNNLEIEMRPAEPQPTSQARD